MGDITTDVNVLMTRWMKLYMNLMILKSANPDMNQCLSEMKDRLAEANEYMMSFFDDVGADPEKAD